jgi:hypothetical protein
VHSQAKAGIAAVVFGFNVAGLVYSQPEKLHTPAWVAYAAAVAFVLAGCSLVARAFGSSRAGDIFVCALLSVLTAIPAWIAWGGGSRRCIATGLGGSIVSSEALCRGSFGAAVVALGVMLAFAVRNLWRSRGAA